MDIPKSIKKYVFHEDVKHGITIFCGDSRKILPKLPPMASCVSDFPYAVDFSYDNYDDTPENLAELVDDLMPVLREKCKCILITPGVSNMWLYPEPDWVLCWSIPGGVGHTKWGFSCWQPILAYGKDPYLANRMGPRPDTFECNQASHKTTKHPCTKPVPVMQWMVMRSSIDTGDTIIDPCMGAGTAIIGAKNCGRKAIGIDKSPAYCQMAVDRLNQESFFGARAPGGKFSITL